MKFTAIILALLNFNSVQSAEAASNTKYTCNSVKVMDGDTIKCVTDNAGTLKIRLVGIDAPELKQTCKNASKTQYACGKKAKEYLEGIVDKQKVECTVLRKDPYNRDVGLCSTPNVKDISAEILLNGYAVSSFYTQEDKITLIEYNDYEAEAMRRKAGIWEGEFEMPYAYKFAFRHRKPSHDEL